VFSKYLFWKRLFYHGVIMEESEIINPHCICANKECPMFGNCKACRAYHKIQKPYCESGRVKRAFMRFTFRIYGAIAGVKFRVQ
jgi:hypothetical protein